MSFNFGSAADFEPRPSDASPISTPRIGSYPNFLRNIDNPAGVGMGVISRPQRDLAVAANRPYTPSVRPPLRLTHGISSFAAPTNEQDVRHLGLSPGSWLRRLPPKSNE
ncbi:hypothetical protein F5877DRAFT_81033 [Lentinula edodes]|nr:hypothetical protein F5877DRAFT_81033 [Lentinula edodes]